MQVETQTKTLKAAEPSPSMLDVGKDGPTVAPSPAVAASADVPVPENVVEASPACEEGEITSV